MIGIGAGVVLAAAGAIAGPELRITSPSGAVSVAVRLDRTGAPEWSVAFRGSILLAWSPLGVELQGSPPLRGAMAIERSIRRQVDESYELVTGKTRLARNRCRELRVQFQERAPSARRLELCFRAYDDGAAFRYVIGGTMDGEAIAIVRELTEFRFPADIQAWAFQVNTFRSSFEGLYLPTTVDAIPDTALVHPPLTLQRADGVALALTEADLTDYAGMYLAGRPGAALGVALPPLPDAQPVCVRGRTPFPSPWRILMIGARAGDLITSTIIENLSSPCALEDVSWIRPGKVMFPWWPKFLADAPGVPSRLDFANQKYYIDFAADHGIRYLEMEPPWYGDEADCIRHPERYDITRPVPELRLPDLFAHARDRGVGIFLWGHWKTLDRQADSALPLFTQWGAVGLKIDFMDRDDQDMIRWYEGMLRATAKHRLMVYLHGASKPTGSRRTWPHLMTVEGVLGNEQNKVAGHVTPEHTVTLPFTRMLAGPMDFTPGGFRNVTVAEFRPNHDRPMVQGTRCHQLAMYVVYESPLVMVADAPSAYRGQPGFSFIEDVPASWDTSVVVDGRIADYIVIARRSGADWYVGAMTDWTPRELRVPLRFLGPGKFLARLYEDGPDADRVATDLRERSIAVARGDTLTLRLAPGGGAAVRLVSVPATPSPR